ncbi:MAG: hypothetical protein ABSA90_06900 [Xanthobacteraceae bacterium]|jgi:hypothetical protein
MIDTFRLSSSGAYIPHIRGEDGELHEVQAAPMWGPQVAFLSSPPDTRELGICGPRGSSKTNVLVLDALSGVGRGFKENYKAVIIRGTQREFSDIIKLIDGIARPIWPSMKFNKLKNYFEFAEGETLELSYFERESDFPLYQGREFVFVGAEELQNFEDFKCYTLMFSCLRSPIPEEILPRKMRFTCNPSGPSHNQIKFRFGLQGVPKGLCGPCIEEKDEHGRIAKRRMIYSGFEDNVLLNRSDPSYMMGVAQSCEGDSARMAAWTRGDWDVISGGYFDEIFHKFGSTIKEPTFDPPAGGKFFFSYDHGGPSPACFLYFWENTDGQDVLFSDGKVRSGRRGDLHIIGEKYFWTGKPNEGANLPIAEMLRQHTEYKIGRGWRVRNPIDGKWSDCMKKGCADTQIWDDSNEIGSIAEMFEEPIVIEGSKHPGIRFERANKGPNSIAIGGSLMRERFIATAPPLDSLTRQGKGLFIVEQECPQFLRTVPVLARDKRWPDKVAENSENHLFDCCRYGLNFDTSPAFSTHRRYFA